MFRLFPIALLASTTINPTISCNPSEIIAKAKRQSASGTPIYPRFSIGNDPRQEVATVGFRLGHIALFVNDLAATKHFYGDVLGMREIFRLDATADYSIMYMGHTQGGLNGTGYMTGEEMMRELYNMAGLIEFISPRNSSNTPVIYRPQTPQTYSHTGLIVPNLAATQSRMIAHNVAILKRIGEKPKLGGLCANVFGMAANAVVTAMGSIGFDGFLIVQDPDGNVLEILQQE